MLAGAAAMTAQALSAAPGRPGVPGAAAAAHSSELIQALLFGSVAAGVGEFLLFAMPIAVGRRAGWSAPATIGRSEPLA